MKIVQWVRVVVCGQTDSCCVRTDRQLLCADRQTVVVCGQTDSCCVWTDREIWTS